MSTRRTASLNRYARKVKAAADAAVADRPEARASLLALVGDPVRLTILDVMAHPLLFGPTFADPTWDGWRTFLAALFGLPLAEGQAEVFRTRTGRTTLPTAPHREAWVIVGRRGGKSRIAALVAIFLACFREYGARLAPGERGTVMLLAADRRQARTLMRYCVGMLETVPALAAMVERRTADSIDLANRVTIEVHTASYKSVRGYTVVGCVADEVAFWQVGDDAANPDEEVLNALRPAMASIPEAVLVGISSPYARRGELWSMYEEHFARDASDVLVWQAATRDMNPAVAQRVIDRAYAEDEIAASAEYGGQFRRDVEGFISREALEAVIVSGRGSLPPSDRFRYRAFVDPSGGSQDSFTLAIAHHEGGRGVLDFVREVRPPFSPDAVCAEFAALLKPYRIATVTGDYFGGEWPGERFRAHGIWYQRSALAKTEIYRQVLPLLMGARVELLDEERLRRQFLGLERRTARGGRDSIDHGPGAHDDVANVVAGVLIAVVGQPESGIRTITFQV